MILDNVVDFLDVASKKWMKEIIDKLDLKKKICFVKDIVKRMRKQAISSRKYLQKTLLIKDCYPKYTKNA